jgi:hypothetical protein
MSVVLAQIVAQVIDPIKLLLAYLIYRKNPNWGVVLIMVVAVSLGLSGVAEFLSAVPVFDILIIPSLIGSVIVFVPAKMLGQKRHQKSLMQGDKVD